MFDGKFLLVVIAVIALLSFLIKKAVYFYYEQSEIKKRFGDEHLFRHRSYH